MFGGIFHDHLEGPWEQARGFLREELEQLRVTLNARWAFVFNDDDTLSTNAIDGDPEGGRKYVANTGDENSPKWETAVYSVATDGTYIEGGPITTTGTISPTVRTSSAVEAANHALLGGL